MIPLYRKHPPYHIINHTRFSLIWGGIIEEGSFPNVFERVGTLESQVCHKNYHKPDGLKQQKFIISQFRRPKVQHQDVSRDMLPLKVLEENPSLPLPVSGGYQQSLASWPPQLVATSLQSLPLSLQHLLCVSSSLLFLIRTYHWIYVPPESSMMISSQDP